MMKSIAILSILLGFSSAFSPMKAGNVKSTTQLRESFGTGLGMDVYSNQELLIGGEANYKQWVNEVNQNNLLNRQYNVIGRVRELNLLKATADNGILSKLESNGVDLVTIEKLLPALESAGLLSVAGNNQQLLVNLAAPLLIEPAPILIPVIAGALKAGPSAFFLAAAVLAGIELVLVTSDAQLPLIGLSAAGTLGLLIVPLAAVAGVAGAALASAKK